MADKSQTLTGDGGQYSSSDLSETARHQVVNTRITAYATALRAELK